MSRPTITKRGWVSCRGGFLMLVNKSAATHFNTLTAALLAPPVPLRDCFVMKTHCIDLLQHTGGNATPWLPPYIPPLGPLRDCFVVIAHCTTLQHAATHCTITLQSMISIVQIWLIIYDTHCLKPVSHDVPPFGICLVIIMLHHNTVCIRAVTSQKKVRWCVDWIESLLRVELSYLNLYRVATISRLLTNTDLVYKISSLL